MTQPGDLVIQITVELRVMDDNQLDTITSATIDLGPRVPEAIGQQTWHDAQLIGDQLLRAHGERIRLAVSSALAAAWNYPDQQRFPF